jgi:hypothetical protein
MTSQFRQGESGRKPLGSFVKEERCRCGFVVDEYDGGRYAVEYADPDTGLVLKECPECRRDLNLRGQA